MANATRSTKHVSSRNTPTLYTSFVSGSTGAVPAMNSANMQRSRGITLIGRNSAGNYTVTLERGCNDICNFVCNVLQVAGSPSLAAAMFGGIWKHSLSTSPSTFTFQIVNAAGAATDPSSGDRVIFSFDPKYSTGLT
jgi:hypothetical protein